MHPFWKALLGAALGLVLAGAAFWFFRGEEKPGPWKETLRYSQQIIPGIDSAQVELKAAIYGESIAGSDGFAPVLADGLEAKLSGVYGPKLFKSSNSLSVGRLGTRFRMAGRPSRPLLFREGQWFPAGRKDPFLGLLPGNDVEPILRVWSELPAKARVTASTRTNETDIYQLKLGKRQLLSMARAWSGRKRSALGDLAEKSKTATVTFAREDGALSGLSLAGSISAGEFAQLLGISSAEAFGGLRRVRFSFAVSILEWSAPRLSAPRTSGTAAEGRKALGRALVPFWVGVGSLSR